MPGGAAGSQCSCFDRRGRVCKGTPNTSGCTPQGVSTPNAALGLIPLQKSVSSTLQSRHFNGGAFMWPMLVQGLRA